MVVHLVLCLCTRTQLTHVAFSERDAAEKFARAADTVVLRRRRVATVHRRRQGSAGHLPRPVLVRRPRDDRRRRDLVSP